MELRQLRYFVAVAEELHFGRAADRVNIAQPGLSQQIKALERSLGAQLFIRGHRGVELTPAGEILLDHARPLLELADRASAVTGLAARGKTSVLKVGTSAFSVHPVAHQILEEFRERYPHIEVEMHPGFTPQHLEDLSRSALDAAFLTFPPNVFAPPLRITVETYEIELALWAGHPLAAFERIPRAALVDEPFIILPLHTNPLAIEHVLVSLFGEPRAPNLVAVAEPLDSSRLELVRSGRGITPVFVPWAASDRLPDVVRRRVEDPPPLLECRLGWNDDRVQPLLPEFVDLAREVVARSGTATLPSG
jgi:DNA-binding transcriptional LysR family regulator